MAYLECTYLVNRKAGPMTAARRLSYARRRNPDGSYDSICERCLQTIATEAHHELLGSHEKTHRCTEVDLLRQLSTDRQLGHLRKQLEAVLSYAKSTNRGS